MDSDHDGGWLGRLLRFDWLRHGDRSRPGEQIGVQAHESVADADALGHEVEVLWLALFTAF